MTTRRIVVPLSNVTTSDVWRSQLGKLVPVTMGGIEIGQARLDDIRTLESPDGVQTVLDFILVSDTCGSQECHGRSRNEH